MKFSEMKYERPNLEEVAAKAKEYVKKLEEADSFEKAKEVLVEKENYMKHVMTMHELVTIRHDIDTRDEFYDAESKFWNEALPQLQEYEVAFTAALLKHPFRKELEKEFGNVVFLNGDLSLKSFSPKIIGEMQKENDLMTKYGKLIASAQIEFEGKTYTISQLSPFKNDPDDERRLAAWKAEGKWYKD
ncbi:MAG: M3 family oligoendopeptidase, partial [Erysipelotrichales bacterium]|nr:M3 family oligoendopeptidase [Erysipelotrichales bacterium]